MYPKMYPVREVTISLADYEELKDRLAAAERLVEELDRQLRLVQCMIILGE